MRNKDFIILLITFVNILIFTEGNYLNINLPKNHLQYYFNFFPAEAKKCLDDASCPYKVRRQILSKFYCIIYILLDKYFSDLQNS